MYRLGVKHARHFQVKGVPGLTGNFFNGIFPDIRLTDVLVGGLVVAVRLVGAMI